MNSVIYELLRSDGSIVINKNLIRSIGLQESVIYCELLSRYFYFKDRDVLQNDNSFYNTCDDLESGTGLTKKQQAPIIKKLIKLGLIDMKVKGMPRKRYFYIIDNEAILTKYILQGKEIQQLRQKVTTGSDLLSLLEVTKGHLNNTKGIITTFEKRKILKCDEEETTLGVEVDQEVIKTYKECISEKISNKEFEILRDLQQSSGKELVNKAIILATMKNGKNLGYIQAVLDDWRGKGLENLDQVNKYLTNWLIKNKKAKENRTKQTNKRAEDKDYIQKKGSFNDYEQRVYDFDKLEKKLLGWDN